MCNNDVILASVRNSLDMRTNSRDAYLMELIEAAKVYIKTEGINLDSENPGDNEIVSMYAAYLFRKRANDNSPMPRMLRYAMNNRLFEQKVSGNV